MYYVYLIQSLQNKKHYVGYSSNLRKRLKEYNDGKSSYTKKFRPWKLIYYEAYTSEKLARAREQKIKQHGKRYTKLLERVLENDED